MNEITKDLLKLVGADMGESFKGAFNIRENGECAGRASSENIIINSKADKPGIDIIIKPNTKGETVYIPACVTKSGVNDLVYNDFFVGDNCDVEIIAGCGVHSEGEEEAQHNGIHSFVVGKNSKVLYKENHIGTGNGNGKRVINPQTYIILKEASELTMDTVQIKGVDSTKRVSKAELADNSKLVIKEKIMTHGDQLAETDFEVELNGKNSSADLVSRSVAKGNSKQHFRSKINGNNECYGHSACDAIIMDNGIVGAMPELVANNCDAALIHEAAIGKIAGEQLIKLMTLGMTDQEAEEKIIEGFLK